MKIFIILPLVIFIGCTTSTSQKTVAPAKDLKVILIPQWHLSPDQNTKLDPKVLPQAKNQNAIYNKLYPLLSNKELDAVVFEGCEGELLKKPDLKFNGWGLQDVTPDNAASAQTHLAFRLMAKLPGMNAICGDDLKFIEANQLALSNIRGLAGFKIRIHSSTGKQQKAYADAAIKILKLPGSSSIETIQTELSKEIKKNTDTFDSGLKDRNHVFAEKISQLRGSVAVIIGLLHIEDLKAQLEARSIAVEVWTPEGLPTEGDAP